MCGKLEDQFCDEGEKDFPQSCVNVYTFSQIFFGKLKSCMKVTLFNFAHRTIGECICDYKTHLRLVLTFVDIFLMRQRFEVNNFEDI